MADLKAAAKCIRDNWSDDMDFLKNAPMSHVLASQALEAWAWMAENGWRVEYDVGDRWCCTSDVFTSHYADTPLGSVLAAMEVETE